MLKIIDKRKYAYLISTVFVGISLIFLFTFGLKLGIDFKGGTLMEIGFVEDENREIIDPDGEEGVVGEVEPQKVPTVQEIQEKLADQNLNSLVIQPSGNESVILRYIASDEEQNEKVLEIIRELNPNAKQLRVDFIGGSVSDQIKKNASIAIFLAIVGIALYIAWAFNKISKPIPSWQYGIGAVVALAHDIIITLGVFAILGKYFEVEIGVPFIAALLTILGYSVNDTIVVYDRTRENLLRSGANEDFEELVNRSLNETLARSINTSLTVIVVLLAIIFFGGETIKFFSVALFIGVTFGTYSSIFVASALLVTSYKYKLTKK